MRENIKVPVSISTPLIYFDTCGYDLFFRPEYQEERDQFITIMNEKKATLMVSWVNVIELGGKLEDSQIEAICSSLDKVETQPIEVEPKTVIKREYDILKKKATLRSKYLPIVCEEIMEWLEDSNNWEKKRGVYSCPKIATFLRKYHCAIIKKQISQNHFIELYQRLEDIQKNEAKIKDIKFATQKRIGAKKDLKRKHRFPYFTEEINSLAAQFILRSDKKGFKNDAAWFDWIHVVVPIAYCNIVILDRRWRHFASQILEIYGLNYPDIGKVFGFNRKGLKAMLDTLQKDLIIP